MEAGIDGRMGARTEQNLLASNDTEEIEAGLGAQ